MLALRVTGEQKGQLTAMFATLSQGSLSGSREFGGYSSEGRGAMAVVPAALESHRQKVAPIGHRASPRGSRATEDGSW